MQTIINIIVFILILGSIITIHEFGHFITAKSFGVYCSQFSIGFGPKLWSYKGKETNYELRALPIGGFVAMAGEEDQIDNEELADIPVERTIKGLSTIKKVIVFGAGVFMNFVLALAVLFCVNVAVGQVGIDTGEIGSVVEGSPAETYGLQSGDVIKQIYISETYEHILVTNYDDIELTQEKLGVQDDEIHVDIVFLRDGQDESVEMPLQFNEEDGRYTIGIKQATRDMNLGECVKYSFVKFYTLGTTVIKALSQLVTNFSSTVSKMSGPAGIYQVTAQVTESGQIATLFNLLAMLSINIGIFNLLPIPGLDGCQIIFAVAEGILKRELPHKLKLVLQVAGLVLVFGLMIIVTCQDLIRIFG